MVDEPVRVDRVVRAGRRAAVPGAGRLIRRRLAVRRDDDARLRRRLHHHLQTHLLHAGRVLAAVATDTCAFQENVITFFIFLKRNKSALITFELQLDGPRSNGRVPTSTRSGPCAMLLGCRGRNWLDFNYFPD